MTIDELTTRPFRSLSPAISHRTSSIQVSIQLCNHFFCSAINSTIFQRCFEINKTNKEEIGEKKSLENGCRKRGRVPVCNYHCLPLSDGQEDGFFKVKLQLLLALVQPSFSSGFVLPFCGTLQVSKKLNSFFFIKF